jgi:hypothetical protein
VELSGKFGVVPDVSLVRMRMPTLAAVLIASALAACGSQDHQVGRTVATGTVIRESGNYSIKVSPAEFTAGQKVQVAVTISGPMLYQSGCAAPLKMDVSDTNSHEIWNLPSNPRPCNVGEAGPPTAWHNLPAGQTTTFTDVWPSSPNLATGSYEIHTSFMLAVTNQAVQPHELPVLQVKVVSS